jgi:hypothetical protein
MRGWDAKSDALFSYVSCEARVPKDHPLRPIRRIVDEALAALSPEFEQLYTKFGRPSIPPERLLRALLLQGSQAPVHRNRFAADSALEEDGFELSVPREIGFVSRLVGRLHVRRIEGAGQAESEPVLPLEDPATANEVTEYFLLSNCTRQVFDTEAWTAWKPSNGPVIGASWGRSASKACQIVQSVSSGCLCALA